MTWVAGWGVGSAEGEHDGDGHEQGAGESAAQHARSQILFRVFEPMADGPDGEDHPEAACGVDDIDGGGIAEDGDGGDEEDTLGGDAGGSPEQGHPASGGDFPERFAEERDEGEGEQRSESHDGGDEVAGAPGGGPALDQDVEQGEGHGGAEAADHADSEALVAAGSGQVQQGDAGGAEGCGPPEGWREGEVKEAWCEECDQDGFEAEDGSGDGDIAAGEGEEAEGLAGDEQGGEQGGLPPLGPRLARAAEDFEREEEQRREGVGDEGGPPETDAEVGGPSHEQGAQDVDDTACEGEQEMGPFQHGWSLGALLSGVTDRSLTSRDGDSRGVGMFAVSLEAGISLRFRGRNRARMDLSFPETDPTPIFDAFRSIHATELLTAAVAHLGVFRQLAGEPLSEAALQARLELSERAFVVLSTALKAMGLLTADGHGAISLTPLAREHLVPGGAFDVSGYLGLGANNPSVLAMVERLRSNRPSGANTHTSGDPGTTHTFRDGVPSALDAETSARESTLCLAGRARNVAPYLGARVRIPDARVLLDVGGGSGIYAYALLRTHPELRATILDRPEVLKVAEECAVEWQVRDRVTFHPANLLEDPYPAADAVLFSNVLHDWDVADCRRLVTRAAASLTPGGRVLIHDVFLNDALDGPLPVALYSALLFALSEGRAYSAGEYRGWLEAAGLTPEPIVPTLVHCGVLTGRNPPE